MIVQQVETIVLPTTFYATLNPGVTELVNDALEHTSIEFEVGHLMDKMIHITATETVAVGGPGNLQCWIELSPVLSVVSAAYWAAIGGGGGAIAPVAPVIIPATGVNGQVSAGIIDWNLHSKYARLVVQAPGAGIADFWTIQATFSGQMPGG